MIEIIAENGKVYRRKTNRKSVVRTLIGNEFKLKLSVSDKIYIYSQNYLDEAVILTDNISLNINEELFDVVMASGEASFEYNFDSDTIYNVVARYPGYDSGRSTVNGELEDTTDTDMIEAIGDGILEGEII